MVLMRCCGAFILVGTSLAPVVALAQEPPTLRLVRDLRIDATEQDLSPITWLAISPTGVIAVSQEQDRQIRFFGSNGAPLGTFGRKGAGPGEFEHMGLYGWLHDTLWVNDPATRRTTLISPSRALVRSVMQLSAIRFSGERPDSLPRYLGVFPRAMFADGSSLVMPLFAAGSRARWPGAEGSQVLFIRVTADGAFLGLLASAPENPCSVAYALPGGGGAIGIPYCAGPLDHLSPDGARYAYAVTEEPTPSSTTYRVTVIKGIGDTAFSRVYSRRSVSIPRRQADSVLAAWSARARFPQEAEAYRSVKVPPFYPALSRVLVGRDDTVWLEEFTPAHQRKTRTWILLDGQGTPIGRVVVPVSVQVAAASRSSIWATETDDDALQHIVRYRITR